jgi:hypothetical protein
VIGRGKRGGAGKMACTGTRCDHARMRNSHISLFAFVALLTGCSNFSYDLASVPFPVSASPVTTAGLTHEPFELQAKDVLWVHGLLGESQPDVARMVQEGCGGCVGIANFRVSVAGSFHDWLLTHLTLGFIRPKTVTIRGEKLTKG